MLQQTCLKFVQFQISRSIPVYPAITKSRLNISTHRISSLLNINNSMITVELWCLVHRIQSSSKGHGEVIKEWKRMRRDACLLPAGYRIIKSATYKIHNMMGCESKCESASHDNRCTGTLLNRMITTQREGQMASNSTLSLPCQGCAWVCKSSHIHFISTPRMFLVRRLLQCTHLPQKAQLNTSWKCDVYRGNIEYSALLYITVQKGHYPPGNHHASPLQKMYVFPGYNHLLLTLWLLPKRQRDIFRSGLAWWLPGG